MDITLMDGDSIPDHLKPWNLNRSQQMSLLSGLMDSLEWVSKDSLEVIGRQAVLHCLMLTRSDEIVEGELGDLIANQVDLLSKDYTHIVSKVVYGIEVFIHVMKPSETSEDAEEAFDELMTQLQAIVDGSRSLVGQDTLTVTVSGDIVLKEVPSSFQDLAVFLKNLPNVMLGERSKAVPKLFVLHPLHRTESFHVDLSITDLQINEPIACLEQFVCISRRVERMIKDTIALKFPWVKKDLAIIFELLQKQKRNMKLDLALLITDHRTRRINDVQLADFLTACRAKYLEQVVPGNWISQKEAEVAQLTSFSKSLKDFTFFPSLSALNRTIQSDLSTTYCGLELNVSSFTDPLVQRLNRNRPGKSYADCLKNSWFGNGDSQIQYYRNLVDLFADFAKTVPVRDWLFVVYVLQDDEISKNGLVGVRYDLGERFQFIPPGKPRKPTIKNLAATTITLKW
ncbi:hypothetical protein BV898_19281 [Hypsibius exemplaris]|uniref:Uncharacterized protein n=1 Tax=Hypsibius exemplaris TaxID=2072580 RepID=A0A9X6RNS9_HYPEX|nr:hypothetical protein BV898_19281 [Hypsibius exemplaris]